MRCALMPMLSALTSKGLLSMRSEFNDYTQDACPVMHCPVEGSGYRRPSRSGIQRLTLPFTSDREPPDSPVVQPWQLCGLLTRFGGLGREQGRESSLTYTSSGSMFKMVWHQFSAVQFPNHQFVWKARSVHLMGPPI